MHLRLPRTDGGRNLVRRIQVLHDTGSSVLTLQRSDVSPLGLANYTRWGTVLPVTFGNGARQRFQSLWVQIRSMKHDGTAWGDWFWELAVLHRDTPGITRCSGEEMRSHFYFGMAPGNHGVAVASTKGGMTSLV